MTSFIETIRTSNTDKVAEYLKTAETMAISGKREMGKSLVLRVATLAAGIHKGFILPGGTTFRVETAIAVAQHSYSRLKGDCMGNIALSEAATNDVVATLVKYLHPFIYNGTPAVTEANTTAEDAKNYGTKLLAVTRQKAISAFPLQTGSEEKKKERLLRVTAAMDAIIEARKNTTTAVKLACLYIYHDRDGSQLSKFDPEKIAGLWLPRKAFSYFQATDNGLIYWSAKDEDSLILIQPVPNNNSAITFSTTAKKSGGGDYADARKPASFPLLVTAATKPAENATSDNSFVSQCKGLATLVKNSVGNKDHELSAEEVLALVELKSAILARELAIQAAQAVADSGKPTAEIIPPTALQERAKAVGKGKVDKDGAAISKVAVATSTPLQSKGKGKGKVTPKPTLVATTAADMMALAADAANAELAKAS